MPGQAGSHARAYDIRSMPLPRRRPAHFVSHPAFLRPGFGRHHPLSTGRQAAVVELVRVLGWVGDDGIHEAPLPSIDDLARFHDRRYLAALERAGSSVLATADDRVRFNLGTMECPVFEGLWERARASVGGSILAATLAMRDGGVGYHPAGGTHHGRREKASGFCYLNDPVFAILTLLDAGAGRVAYVDLDAHHGDGVELAFADDPRVSMISLHEADRWPGSGPTGTSAGGRIVNVMLPRRFGDARYRMLAEAVLFPALERWRPDAVVVTLGADTLAGDPLSSVGLFNHTLWDLTERIIAGVPVAVVLGGGGYNPWTAARLWAGLWGRLTGVVFPDPLPAVAQDILGRLDSDLVDEDDRLPHWTTTLADPPLAAAGGTHAVDLDALIAAARASPPV